MSPVALITPLLLLFALPAGAELDVAAAYQSCIACHGARGEGNPALQAPAIAHLDASYVAQQLGSFRAGVRGGETDSASAQQMRGMALLLPDQQTVEVVARYIGEMPAVPQEATVEGDIAMGADYYNQFCGACHGPGAAGLAALNSPALAGGSDWYLLSQLQAYRSGQRGAKPEDRSGRQMAAMAAVLPDEQALRDVVAFIASLEP